MDLKSKITGERERDVRLYKQGANWVSVPLIIYACIIIVYNLIEGFYFDIQGEEVLYHIDMATVVSAFTLLFVVLIWREVVYRK